MASSIGSVEVKLKRGGIEALLKSAKVREDLTDRAQRVLAAAQADSHDDSGDYERSLGIKQDTTDRAAVRVGSNDPKAHILEAKYGILARSLDAAG